MQQASLNILSLIFCLSKWNFIFFSEMLSNLFIFCFKFGEHMNPPYSIFFFVLIVVCFLRSVLGFAVKDEVNNQHLTKFKTANVDKSSWKYCQNGRQRFFSSCFIFISRFLIRNLSFLSSAFNSLGFLFFSLSFLFCLGIFRVNKICFRFFTMCKAILKTEFRSFRIFVRSLFDCVSVIIA